MIDVPKDVLNAEMEWYWPTDAGVAASLPGYRPTTKGHPRMIKEAARLILAAERPVLYVGGGMLKARGAEALRELVELTGIPVVTTLMARGVFPDSHALNLGMPGMHGTATATTAMQKSDLLIALGSRFDDRITGQRSLPASPATEASTMTATWASHSRTTRPVSASSSSAHRGTRRQPPTRTAGSPDTPPEATYSPASWYARERPIRSNAAASATVSTGTSGGFFMTSTVDE